MSAHALLGASKASQWINCPPSARLTENMPDKGSFEAKEGTDAHKLAEIKLRRRLTICNSAARQALEDELEQLKNGPYYNVEMENVIQAYTEIIEERFMAAKSLSEDAVILLEERIDLTEWVPEAFGTCDVVLIADGVLEVIDLKYGKGVPVSAVGNPQIQLYGLGAWNSYNYLYDINAVRLTIIQPRRDSISTEVLDIQDLLDWAENTVKSAAKLAFAGKGEFKSGDHCKWCLAKAQCRARADENIQALSYEAKKPTLLSLDEIGSILFIAKQLQTWAKDVSDYAQKQALLGKKIPQWKLVEGKSNRAIADKEKAIQAFTSAGLQPEIYLKPPELFGITDLEQKIGKKKLAKLLSDLIIKPPGKPALAPETDKRPEWNSLENDFANIEMED
jgi:hypothetical protein